MEYIKTFENYKNSDLPKPGDWVELIHMSDRYAPSKGTLGQVVRIDDIGNIIVNWENGSSLSLIPEIDKYRILSDDEVKKYKNIKKFNI